MVLHLMHKVRTDHSNWTAKSSENIWSSSGAGGAGGLLNVTKPSIFGGNLSFILYFLPPTPSLSNTYATVFVLQDLKKKLTPCMTKLWVQVQCFTCFMNNYDFFTERKNQYFFL